MRMIVFCLFFCLLNFSIQAQTQLTGFVKDIKGVPVAGATISINESYDGTTSDSTGYFSFSTSEKGQQLLIVSAIGYLTSENKISLNGVTQQIAIAIKEEINEMKAVVITAGSFEASDKKRATVLSSIDMLTTASANADVTAAVKTLPGAQHVGESEGLFVRGGTASETRTYIDGTLVNNFFYSSVPNIAQRGRFSPWLFKGTVFSAGGYSALYGQALSSALILESVDLPETSSGSIGISPIGASFGYQRLAKNNKSSWGVSYGYTNVHLAFALLGPVVDYFKMPSFHTGDANFRIKTSATGILKYYGYFSQNALGVRNNSIDTLGYKDAFRLSNFNMYHNVSWRENLIKGWKFNGGISYANNQDDIKGSLGDNENKEVSLTGLEQKNFDLDTKGNYFNAKAVLEKRLKGLTAVRFGSEYNYSNDHSDYTAYDHKQYKNQLKENLIAGFTETDVYITNDLAAKLGARVEHSSMLEKFNFAPRASLAYKLGKESQVSLAYGMFYQNPEKKYLSSSVHLDFTKASHYIFQYQKTSPQKTLRAEIFYKKYQDLLKTTISNNRETAVSNKG